VQCNMDEINRRRTTTQKKRRHHGPRSTHVMVLIIAFCLAAVLALSSAVAQSGCAQSGRNMQCNEFGRIAMDNQQDIRGEPVELSVDITLRTGYEDQGARWLLFSVRNVEPDGSDPVTIELLSFHSTHGNIATTRVEQPSASELNLWVDILDTPIGAPIEIELRVGATERGAFELETLVMAFDRGYVPIQTSSGDASLFSFTLLGVNEETGKISSGKSFLEGQKLPGFGVVPLVAVLAAVAVLVQRRRS